MGRLDIIKDGIKQYFKDLIECGKQEVDILEANVEIHKIIEGYEKTDGWIPADESYPSNGRYVLLSFENFSLPAVGRCEEDEDGVAFYIGDDDEPCVAYDLFVNAWMELPKVYRNENVCD